MHVALILLVVMAVIAYTAAILSLFHKIDIRLSRLENRFLPPLRYEYPRVVITGTHSKDWKSPSIEDQVKFDDPIVH